VAAGRWGHRGAFTSGGTLQGTGGISDLDIKSCNKDDVDYDMRWIPLPLTLILLLLFQTLYLLSTGHAMNALLRLLNTYESREAIRVRGTAAI